MDTPLVGGIGVVGSALTRTLVDRTQTVTPLARSPAEATLLSGVPTGAATVTDSDVTVAALTRDRRGRGGD